MRGRVWALVACVLCSCDYALDDIALDETASTARQDAAVSTDPRRPDAGHGGAPLPGSMPIVLPRPSTGAPTGMDAGSGMDATVSIGPSTSETHDPPAVVADPELKPEPEPEAEREPEPEPEAEPEPEPEPEHEPEPDATTPSEPDAESELAASAAELAILHGVQLFPVNTPIEVCFMEGNAIARRQVRFAIEGTWGATTKLNFTGWESCPTAAGSIPATTVPIRLTSGSGGIAAMGYRARLALAVDDVPVEGNVERAQMRVGIDGTGEWTERVAIHEFGHVLGMFHEHQRSDSPRCTDDDNGGPPTCADNAHCAPNLCDLLGPRSGDPARPFFCINGNDTTVADLSAATPYDADSVTNHCSMRNPATLSAWDMFAAQQFYGRRNSDLVPLFTTYNDERKDFATGTWESFRGPSSPDAPYRTAYVEGWVFRDQAPDTVPLDLYFHAGRGDYVLVAHAVTRHNAMLANYVRVGTHGYVYQNPQPGTVPLKLMWHADREDNYMAALDRRGFKAATALGYVTAHDEGHVFVPEELPYHVTWRYYHPGWGDHLVTVARSQLAIDAVNAGYQRQNLDMLTLRHEVPGAVRVNQFWNETTLDYAAVINTATPPGYTWIGAEGFIFANGTTVANGAPVLLRWNQALGDNFTTVERSAQSGPDYIVGANQGVTLRLNNIGH